MDCLAIGLGMAVLLLLVFSILGLLLEQPAMTWGFGYLALIGSIPVLWLGLDQPIGKRYGARGTRVFNRILGITAAVELSIPVVLFFVTGALEADTNPAVMVPLLLFFNLTCLAVIWLWWQRTHRS